MRILVDTSVWSHALRRKKESSAEQHFLYKLIEKEEQIFTTGIILQEILSGISGQKMFQQIRSILANFAYIEATKDNFIAAAELRNKCKTKGVSAGSIDFLIACVAIHHDLYLATFDNDFSHISKCCPLKILKEQNPD